MTKPRLEYTICITIYTFNSKQNMLVKTGFLHTQPATSPL